LTATALAQPAVDANVGGAPKRSALYAIASAGIAAVTISFLVAFTSGAVHAELGEPLVVALLLNWITLSYVLCGALAWWHRPASRFGPLMILAGFANFVSTLSWANSDLLFTLGQSLDLVLPVLFLHVFLAYPSGWLSGRFDKPLVATAYVTALGLQLVRMTVGGYGPNNLLEVTSNPAVGLWVVRVQLLLVAAFCVTGVGILALRRWRGGRPLRRSLALLIDAFALGLLMIAFLFAAIVFGGPAVAEIRWAMFATLGLAPVAFLLGLLVSRLARTGVGELLVELRADPQPSDLRDALARALRDPSLTLVYWLPEFHTYADLDGRPVDLKKESRGRATRPIDLNGKHVAALLHDAALADEPALLDAVTVAVGITLENGRLHAELRARLEELRGSRARVIEAGQKERQRLERNLHDGAQQRLIALSLELDLLAERLPTDGDARSRLHRAKREIAVSLEELRAVARGIHPAVLSGHGLEVALESLAARASVPVQLTVDLGSRLDEPLEVAAYYVVSESLANIGKHAQATSARVDVGRAGRDLFVEIVDDGVGGADTERGTGLRGLADRVEALGGRLRVWTPHGGGTRVRAEMPCA
jgi:signal transduction histidine kinase